MVNGNGTGNGIVQFDGVGVAGRAEMAGQVVGARKLVFTRLADDFCGGRLFSQ